ncbi:MAG: hypothetical protein ABSB31_02625 [Dehalococcoidia bacterium]
MKEKREREKWKWVKGIVNDKDDHIKIWHVENENPVALLAPGQERSFVVQFLLADKPEDIQTCKIIEAVRHELDYFLIEKLEENPWAYANYHCNSGANMYSKYAGYISQRDASIRIGPAK